jgi:hypothetical protein
MFLSPDTRDQDLNISVEGSSIYSESTLKLIADLNFRQSTISMPGRENKLIEELQY